jgi:beta-glucanase (GH16 family)
MKDNRLISIKNTLLISLLMFTLWSCKNDDNEIVKRNWELVWQDEFNTPGAPDAAKWTYDIGNGPNNDGWGNAELQSYTNRAENIVIADGKLKITAIKNGNAFTSARIKTQGLFEQGYGRIEASIKLPYGPGIWPAFWMIGNDVNTKGWPQCGEIDIMEGRGQEPNIIHGTVHGPGYSAGAAITASYGLQNARFDTDYHLFAVEWTENCIDFYVDDVLYSRITPEKVTGNWVYDHPFFIILNVAVGGNYVGWPTTSTPFPQTMYVDYVKVYKEVK